jgi:lipid II:glycine glycyltransferase (peptidoglycan interpeptide bridge formation enzyme)
MTVRIECTENEDVDWNKRLLGTQLGTIYQSKEMKINSKSQGSTPKFLKFYDENDNIIGQLLYSEKKRFSKRKITKQILNRVIKSKILCQWSNGPIIFDKSYHNEIFTTLGEFLIEKKYVVSGTEHPFASCKINEFKNKLKFIPWSTFIIDLQIPKDEIYNKIEKHNGRKNIERSIKRNVEVEEINEKSLFDYYELYVEMQKQAGKPNDYKTFDTLLNWWKLFRPIGYSGFLAKRNNIPVGGLLFSFFNGHIIEGGVVRSEIDRELKLYSQDYIKWKIIEWGIENKKHYYNFAGFNPDPQSEKESGILKYKKKWGGKQYDYWLMKS